MIDTTHMVTKWAPALSRPNWETAPVAAMDIHELCSEVDILRSEIEVWRVSCDLFAEEVACGREIISAVRAYAEKMDREANAFQPADKWWQIRIAREIMELIK